MDYTYILNEILNLITNNQVLGFSLAGFLFLLVLFIVSRTFRKSGLFLLALTFLVDYTIRSLNFDLYGYFPVAKTVVNFFYGLGFLNFLIRTSIMLIKISKRKDHERDSKLKSFLKFTGIRPFFIVLLIRAIDVNGVIPQNIMSLLTSLSFLYMAFKSLYSTYVYLTEKEGKLIDDKMNFDDIRAYLKSPKKKEPRRVRKSFDDDIDDDIKIYEPKSDSTDKVKETNPISISKINRQASKDKKIKSIEEDLSNTDIINIIGDKSSKNIVTMRLTDLKTSEESSYTSDKCDFKLIEDNEFKIDLEFLNFNDYDYGRFIDLLIEYSKNKESYKFELIVSSKAHTDLKIVFFDPSNIFDLDGEENIGGRLISMNFPKYKINFIKGNY